MIYDRYILLNQIDMFVNELLDKSNNSWSDEVKNIIHDESIKLTRISNFGYDEIFQIIKSKFIKKLNIYLIESNKKTKVKKSFLKFRFKNSKQSI